MAFFMDETNTPSNSLYSWLCYALSPGIKARHRRELQQQLPNANDLSSLLQHAQHPEHPINREVTDAAMREIVPFLKKNLTASSIQKQAERALAWEASSANHTLLTAEDRRYPDTLAAVPDAPPLLYVRGNPDALQGPHVAIVGSRKASPGGLAQAQEVASDLALAGIGTVSGMALGIDAAAHRGSLSAAGITVAVAATAPDRVYPAAHRELADKIAQSGAIVTEFPLGSSLRPGCFPRRNRLISGLSLGVLVVEAAVPSGTLTTAQHALNQGREVLAMPGSVKNPQVNGCHTLIKEGGILATGADDILAALEFKLRPLLGVENRPTVRSPRSTASTTDKNRTVEGTSEAATGLLEKLGYNPTSVDELVHRCKISAPTVTALLLQLELKGLVSQDISGRYVRC